MAEQFTVANNGTEPGFWAAVAVVGTVVVGSAAIAGCSAFNDHPAKAAVDKAPAHKHDGPEKIQVKVDNKTLSCVLDPNKYKVESGDNLWDITDAQTMPFQAGQNGSDFIAVWNKNIMVNQNRDQVGDNPNLIYVGDELNLLKHCNEVQPPAQHE